jgi:hypothetical protein
MKRARQQSDGLRELLIADREKSLRRWAIPGRPDEFLEDLRAHVPVVVSSAQLMQALMHAGLPCDDYAYGGRYFQTSFVLDETDQLSLVTLRA